MYLVDTNIFLEALLRQERAAEAGVFSFTYSLCIYGYIFLCRSELRSRSCEKTLAPINENQSQNRKLNRPG